MHSFTIQVFTNDLEQGDAVCAVLMKINVIFLSSRKTLNKSKCLCKLQDDSGTKVNNNIQVKQISSHHQQYSLHRHEGVRTENKKETEN